MQFILKNDLVFKLFMPVHIMIFKYYLQVQKEMCVRASVLEFWSLQPCLFHCLVVHGVMMLFVCFRLLRRWRRKTPNQQR